MTDTALMRNTDGEGTGRTEAEAAVGSLLRLVLPLGLLLLAACGFQAESGGQAREAGGLTLERGTVRFIDLEGGFYGIVSDAGERYLPLDLPQEFRRDGLRVAFRAEPAGNMATIYQWGKPVHVTEMHALE